jgi:hypothetical protein
MADHELWRQAWERLPLWQEGGGTSLFTVLGDAAYGAKNAPCPSCGEGKGKWGVFRRAGRWFFKCHNLDCSANNSASGHDEIGYLALRKNLSRSDAAREYLHLALPESVIQGFATKPEYLEPPESSKPSPADGEPRSPWHAIWQKLKLLPDDREKLKTARGFSDDTIDILGFRSNRQDNLAILDNLAERHLKEFLEEGIYKRRRRDPEPDFQLYGFGITGKKKEDGTPEFGETHPILIPYLDADGVPFYLRPHKGGVKRPTSQWEDLEILDEDDRPCASHVYCPFTVAQLIAENDGLCVLTEGEFKVGALFQCRIPAIACPGIAFIANPAFKRELLGIFDQFGVTDLVVIYDNEVKDDPAFPEKFKEDPWKRYDTAVWAQYAERELRDFFIRQHGSIKVGSLPDQYRENGKADFDGILARMVREKGNIAAGTRAARKIFFETIRKAQEDNESLDLFPTTAQRIIASKLARLRYKPLVPFGSEKERALAATFFQSDDKGKPIDADLASLFKGVVGCYYKRNKVDKSSREDLLETKQGIEEALETCNDTLRHSPDSQEHQALKRALLARRKAVWERLRGLPEPISNFVLTCEYKLHTADGTVDRLVRLKDSKDLRRKDLTLRRVKPKQLARTSEFREWCLSTGDGVYKGGEKDLQALTQDMDHHAFQRDIHEIVRFGCDDDSRIWFFGDCAFDPEGKFLSPDNSNVFWHEGIGYTFETGADERGSTSFGQGKPYMLKPHESHLAPLDDPALHSLVSEQLVSSARKAAADRFKGQSVGDEQIDFELRKLGYKVPMLDEVSGVSLLFKTFAEDVFDSVGGFEGWLLLGMLCAYAAGPELVKTEGHPGAWIVGRMSGGKTTLLRLGARIWGFRDLHDCTRLDRTTTPVALNRILSQYSSLPVVLDEFRQSTVDPIIPDVIRASFNRGSSQKGVADYSNRTRASRPYTMPLVGGESSTTDAATRSRFVHITVAATRRIGEGQPRLRRMFGYAPHLYHIGRYLLSRRKEFVEGIFTILNTLTASKTWREAIANDRVRYVHAAAYAGMHVAATMLGVGASFTKSHFLPSPESFDSVGQTDRNGALISRSLLGFQNWIITHASQAYHDVLEETFLSQFWRDVFTGVSRDEIAAKFFAIRGVLHNEDGFLRIVDDEPFLMKDEMIKPSAHRREGQLNVCFVAFNEVHQDYSTDLRKRDGTRAPLSINDLRREMEKEVWFLPPPRNSTRVHRVKMAGRHLTCWAISLGRKDPGDPDSPYLFPHADDLLGTLLRQKSEED